MGLVAVLVSRLPPAPPLGRRAVPSTLTVTHCFSQGLLEAHSTTPPAMPGPSCASSWWSPHHSQWLPERECDTLPVTLDFFGKN